MKPRKSGRSFKSVRPRLLAGWQRAMIWILWLVFFGLCIASSDRGKFSFREFLTLAAAVAVTFWCLNNPLGIDRVEITSPASMRGEFRSRTNWELVLLGAALLLVGVAATCKILHDLRYGLTTVVGVFADFALFFLEMFLEQVTRGTEGDVTESKLYILIVFLPIGLLVLWYNLLPLIYRGRPFAVSADGQLSVWLGGSWQPLRLADYRRISADGVTIQFSEPTRGKPVLTLPQERVFSRTLGTRVNARVLADFFRQRLENAGFQVVPKPEETGSAHWEYQWPD